MTPSHLTIVKVAMKTLTSFHIFRARDCCGELSVQWPENNPRFHPTNPSSYRITPKPKVTPKLSFTHRAEWPDVSNLKSLETVFLITISQDFQPNRFQIKIEFLGTPEPLISVASEHFISSICSLGKFNILLTSSSFWTCSLTYFQYGGRSLSSISHV